MGHYATYTSVVCNLTMKIIITFWIASILLSCSNRSTSKEKLFEMDSLSGNYTMVTEESGVPIRMAFYTKNRLEARSFLRNGYVFDQVQLDSLGNVIDHDPILVLLNSESFKKDDSLVFQIKNVDSLTLYQYYWTTSEVALELEGSQKIEKQKPINSKIKPFIKIPRRELARKNEVHFIWGYLESKKDSSHFTTYKWDYFKETFEFKW